MTIDISTFRQQLIDNINDFSSKHASHYRRVTCEDAIHLVEEMSDSNLEAILQVSPRGGADYRLVMEICLDGAKDIYQWSYSGRGLIGNYDIAKRYCTPSEFKKRKEGKYAPCKGMTWLDIQAIAFESAAGWVWCAADKVKNS